MTPAPSIASPEPAKDGHRRRHLISLAIGLLLGASSVGIVVLAQRCSNTVPDPAAPQPIESDAPRIPHLPDGASPSRNLKGTCVLEGHIRDDDGIGISGAIVRLRLLDEPWRSAHLPHQVITDTEGRYRLENLTDQARYQIFAWAEGHATGDSPGRCHRPSDLILERGGTIQVSLLDPQHNPVSNATVTIAGSSLWPARVAVSGPDGQLTFAGLAEGIYALSARDPHLAGTIREPVDLNAGDHVALELRMAPVAPIRIQVVSNASGDPVPDAWVTAIPLNAPLLRVTEISDTDGRVIIPVADTTPHRITVFAPDFLPVVRDDVTPPESITISLRPGAVISGVVQTPSGQPIANAHMEVRFATETVLTIPDGKEFQFLHRRTRAELDGLPSAIPQPEGIWLPGPSTVPLPLVSQDDTTDVGPGVWQPSDENGHFRITGLPDGDVFIGATHSDYILHRPPRLTVSSGQRLEQIPVLMRAGQQIDLRSINRRGEPISAGEITVFDADGDILRSEFTDSDGAVMLNGLPLSVLIQVRSDGHISAIRRLNGAHGEHRKLTVTLLDADRTLRGLVTDPQGNGLPHLMIEARLTAPNTHQILTGMSNSTGTFELPGACGEDYRIRVLRDEVVLAQAGSIRADVFHTIVVQNTPTSLSDLSGQTDETSFASTFREAGRDPLPPESIALREPSQTSFPTQSITAFPDADRLDVTDTPQPPAGSLPIVLQDRNRQIVVTSVERGSQIAAAGLKAGAILQRINGQPVHSVAAARKALAGRAGSVVMLDVLQDQISLSLIVQRVP